jgi:predicted O-linked N-acetylglucosamine transferase (SPINDLY family)
MNGGRNPPGRGQEARMDERLVAADAALKAGRTDEAIDHLSALLEADPQQSAQLYRTLLLQCYRVGRMEEGVKWGEVARRRYPRDVGILNVLGVMYRRLVRYPEALGILDLAYKLAPNDTAVLTNRGNVLLDLQDGVRGEAMFAKLVRLDPRNAEHQRQLGRALNFQGKRSAAMTRLRQAITIQKDFIEPWLDMIGIENEENNTAEADALIERALAVLPDHPRLLEARAVVMRRSHQLRATEAYLLGLLPRFADAAWLQYQLGCAIADRDRERANVHLRRAYELDPDKLEHLMALIESLERTRSGDEGANIEEAYQLTLVALDRKFDNSAFAKILFEVLVRVCAFDDLDRVGDFTTRGRTWAKTGRHTALLKQLAHVKTLEDRYELLEQHRIWARETEALAAKTPIKHPPPRADDGKIRLGFMSSDLRQHPVGYFALPLFEHIDERFEIYCYSFYQGDNVDRMQEYFASRSKEYRWKSDINVRDAAQMIADDQLDILFELGGSTHMNKLEVMAFKPAPKQASWLGYPHSAGLSTIDYLLCDPYNAPPRRDLLIEQPLMMPHTWIALGRMVFSEGHVIAPGVPQDRHGHITFGTANNPHKYNPETLALWARVLLAVPDSTFLFIRPEGGTASFRRNIVAEFAKHGVAPERIQFNAVRGAHMAVYNEVDITLDPFPLTGGTTTTESLWMGVPVVSLIGEAFYERLSASILANSGLADLATEAPDEYVRIAVALAADHDRRVALRHDLRNQIRSGPLGQTQQFATDFYELVARTVRP